MEMKLINAITVSGVINRNSGRYVLMQKYSFGWETVSETRKGVNAETLRRVIEYHIEVKQENPRNFIAVQVEE